MTAFNMYIGIDYSGAQTPSSRLKGLEIYASAPGDQHPQRITTPAALENKCRRNWTRREIAEWLTERVHSGERFIAGIDHGFSFPHSYYQRYELTGWDEFLDDFVEHWPTHGPNTYVDFIRDRSPTRTGRKDEYRITERWTSSAKSVFAFDMQGQVAKSTHAGIPWLRHIRRELGDGVHFWPFDGWQSDPSKSVLAEVYPSIFRNRYKREKRTTDQQDAYAVAKWLCDLDARGLLDRYFHPPLTEQEQRVAELEGWILGVA